MGRRLSRAAVRRGAEEYIKHRRELSELNFAETLARYTPVYSGAVLYHIAQWVRDSSLRQALEARVRSEHDPRSVSRARRLANSNPTLAAEYAKVLSFLGASIGVPPIRTTRSKDFVFTQDFTHWNVFHRAEARLAMHMGVDRVRNLRERPHPLDGFIHRILINGDH